ncbi:hypothetical protein CsatB_014634 [Cannabis sativa]|uniref:Uncharacterized protein n=1 Tax=Cannabis sativa TaxID=3483 RepID=A0A803QBR1_CANSA
MSMMNIIVVIVSAALMISVCNSAMSNEDGKVMGKRMEHEECLKKVSELFHFDDVETHQVCSLAEDDRVSTNVETCIKQVLENLPNPAEYYESVKKSCTAVHDLFTSASVETS